MELNINNFSIGVQESAESLKKIIDAYEINSNKELDKEVDILCQRFLKLNEELVQTQDKLKSLMRVEQADVDSRNVLFQLADDLVPFLNLDADQIDISKLDFRNFIPEIQDKTSAEFQNFYAIIKNLFVETNREFFLQKHRLDLRDKGFDLDQLKDLKKEEFTWKYELIQQTNAENFIKNLLNGHTIQKSYEMILNLNMSEKFFIYRSNDFKNSKAELEFTDFSTQKAAQNMMDQEKKRAQARAYLKSVHESRKNKRKLDDLFKNISGDDFNRKLMSLKSYLLAARVEVCSYEQLNDEQISLAAEKVIEKNNYRLQEESDKAFRELMAPSKKRQQKHIQIGSKKVNRAALKANPKNVSSRTRNKIKNIASTTFQFKERELTEAEKLTRNLMEAKNSIFKIHPRVSRWKVKDLLELQRKDLSYAACTDEQMAMHKANHDLSGIERILSESNLYNALTCPYTYKQHQGCSLFTEKVVGGEKVYGITYVAFNDAKEIYHAMFEEVKEAYIPIEMLSKKLEIENQDFEVQMEEGWEQVGDVKFEVKDNKVCEMTVNRGQPIIFRFHPLYE